MINYFACINKYQSRVLSLLKDQSHQLNKSSCYYLLMFHLLMHVRQFVDFIQHTYQDYYLFVFEILRSPLDIALPSLS